MHVWRSGRPESWRTMKIRVRFPVHQRSRPRAEGSRGGHRGLPLLLLQDGTAMNSPETMIKGCGEKPGEAPGDEEA
jgi:hypothetical protein